MRLAWLLIVIAAFLACISLCVSADTVTTCQTDYDYVTDISGAFHGDQSDIILEYNPVENVTGWNTVPTFNYGWMAGVNYDPTPPSTYFINGDGNGHPTATLDTLTLSPMPDHPQQAYAVSSAVKGDLGTFYLPLPKKLYVADMDAVRTYRILDTIPLKSIFDAYNPNPNKIFEMTLEPDFSSGTWPGIMTDSDLTYQPRHTAWIYTGDIRDTASYDVKTGFLTIGEDKTALANGAIGVVRYESYGEPVGNVPTVTISLKIYDVDTLSYVNPSAGVTLKNPSQPVYWFNNQANTSVTLVIAHTSGGSSTTTLSYYTQNGEGDRITITFSLGAWTAAHGLSHVSIGQWPAIAITDNNGFCEVKPISSFMNFADYTVVDMPVNLPWGEDYDDVKGIRIITPETVAVTNTTVRIPNGGLWKQDAEFNLAQSFPSAEAVMLQLKTSAHTGDSITLYSIGDSITLPASIDGLTINGKTYPFNSVKFMWVSETAGDVMIAGETYPAALYINGNSYAAGAVWADVGTAVIHLIDGNLWTMRLDGIWAPAIDFYTGENIADEKTEMMPLKFQWNKAQALFVFMGTLLLLSVLCAYIDRRFEIFGGSFKPLGGVDWVIIIVALLVSWALL